MCTPFLRLTLYRIDRKIVHHPPLKPVILMIISISHCPLLDGGMLVQSLG